MKVLLIVYFCVFSIAIVSAQNNRLDSLRTELNSAYTAADSLEIIKGICGLLIDNINPETGLKDNLLFLDLAKREGDLELQSRASKYLCEYYMNLRDKPNALRYGNNAIAASNKLGKLSITLLDYNQLGRAYNYFEDYENAIKAYKKGVSYYDNSEIKSVSTLYSNLAIAYNRIGDIENEVKYLKLAIKFAEKYGEVEQVSFANYVLGYSLMENGRYDDAEKYFIVAMKDSTKFKVPTYLYMNHHALGINYSRWGKYNKALYHNTRALDHYKKTGNKLYEGDVLNNMATLFYRQKEFQKAAEFSQKAIIVAKELKHERLEGGATINLLQAQNELKVPNSILKKSLIAVEKFIDKFDHRDLDVLAAYWMAKSLIAENEGAYSKSLEYYKKFNIYNDSLKTKNLEAKYHQLNVEYQTQKKEEQIKQLNEEKATQRKKLIYLLVGSGLLSIILGFTYYYYRKTTLQKNVIVELQKETHHRIKNNLSIINSFIDVAGEQVTDEKSRLSLIDLQNRISSISEIHRLLVGSSKDTGEVNLKEYINALRAGIENSLGFGDKVLKTEIYENIYLDQSKVFSLGLIINEFLTNSIKHSTNKNGDILLSIEQVDEKLELILHDKSTIIKQEIDFQKPTGYGIRLINMLTRQLDGKGDWSTENGLKYTLTI